jgi:hypothetical protein
VLFFYLSGQHNVLGIAYTIIVIGSDLLISSLAYHQAHDRLGECFLPSPGSRKYKGFRASRCLDRSFLRTL